MSYLAITPNFNDMRVCSHTKSRCTFVARYQLLVIGIGFTMSFVNSLDLIFIRLGNANLSMFFFVVGLLEHKKKHGHKKRSPCCFETTQETSSMFLFVTQHSRMVRNLDPLSNLRYFEVEATTAPSSLR